MAAVSERETGPVVVTGATGFVGASLARRLDAAGFQARPLSREMLQRITDHRGDRSDLLGGSGCVVHLAARAHVLDESSTDQLEIYRQVNRDMTLKLARAASSEGVRRFVFVSSIRVNGSSSERAFRPQDTPRPEEPYAISKFEAEQGLWEIAAATGLEVVVVRPPLVYGPGVKANFRRLLGLAASGLPLPLATVTGRRSLIGLSNLCDLLQRCLSHPAASGKTLLVSDGDDITLPDLLRELAAGMARPARLFPMPQGLLRALAVLAGQGSTFDKLVASLQIDSAQTFDLLAWRPPVSVSVGLRETARWYAEGRHSVAQNG